MGSSRIPTLIHYLPKVLSNAARGITWSGNSINRSTWLALLLTSWILTLRRPRHQATTRMLFSRIFYINLTTKSKMKHPLLTASRQIFCPTPTGLLRGPRIGCRNSYPPLSCIYQISRFTALSCIRRRIL